MPFMPSTVGKDLRHHLVRGMVECVRDRERQVLSNLTAKRAIDGIQGPRVPCRESVVSGELLLKRHALKLDANELGPHQELVDCAAEVPLVPSIKVPPMFSALRDLRKACFTMVSTGRYQYLPWCRGIQHLFKGHEIYLHDDAFSQKLSALALVKAGVEEDHAENKYNDWVQKLVKAGVITSEAADGGVVRLSALSLDVEDSSYLGLFRVRNAAVIQDEVVTCDP